jgi:benzil reductase ((S)-benzoin forming)
MELEGKVCVITGASRGLGAGLARDMLDRGMRLGLCSRSAPAFAEGDRVLAREVDVTDEAAVDRFAAAVADRFGHIDLWINNAGVLEPIGPLRGADGESFRRHIDININGVFHGSRAYVRHVRATGKPGVLVNISSGAGRNPYFGWSAYCAGKAAVDRMSQCLALEEAEVGLRVHSVAPGIIDTHMQELIRGTPAERFPQVDRFKKLKEDEAFSSTGFVAARMLELAFDPAHHTDEVLVGFPLEKG